MKFSKPRSVLTEETEGADRVAKCRWTRFKTPESRRNERICKRNQFARGAPARKRMRHSRLEISLFAAAIPLECGFGAEILSLEYGENTHASRSPPDPRFAALRARCGGRGFDWKDGRFPLDPLL